MCVCGPSHSALNNPQQQQRAFVVQWVGRARLALSFVSGCPGRRVPVFFGCDLGVRAQLPGWWLCAHAGPSFVILGYPGPVGGSNRVHPIYTLYARRRCTSVVIFVQSIMLMFAPSYLMFKTIAEHTADIASEYKLTHRKVCEFSCRISRHRDTHSNLKKYSSTMVYWIYSITFPWWIVPGGAISVRCAANFT